MPAEHDTLCLRVFETKFFKPQAQFIAGSLPRQPADIFAIEFPRELLAITAGGQRYYRIRVHMIDMLLRHISMQRCVYGSGSRVQVISAMGQKADHFIFKRHAAILFLERLQLFHIQRGETVHPNRTHIATGPLYPEHFDGITCDWIGLGHFRRSITATIVRNAFIRTEQVGTVQQ